MSDAILDVQGLVGGYGKMTILNGTTFQVLTLHDEAKKRDPDKTGLNFILSPNIDAGGGGGGGGAAGAIDPATGLPTT